MCGEGIIDQTRGGLQCPIGSTRATTTTSTTPECCKFSPYRFSPIPSKRNPRVFILLRYIQHDFCRILRVKRYIDGPSHVHICDINRWDVATIEILPFPLQDAFRLHSELSWPSFGRPLSFLEGFHDAPGERREPSGGSLGGFRLPMRFCELAKTHRGYCISNLKRSNRLECIANLDVEIKSGQNGTWPALGTSYGA